MGTHPIFESDFDCLTDMVKRKRKLEILFEGEVEKKEKIIKIEESEKENDFEDDNEDIESEEENEIEDEEMPEEESEENEEEIEEAEEEEKPVVIEFIDP